MALSENWRVDEWLETLGLESYLKDFIDNGYDNRELCANLKPEELDVIGVKDKKHLALLLDQAKLLLLSNGSDQNRGVTPQNYSEPWQGNTNYTEPFNPAGDKKVNRNSPFRGADHPSKKGHTTSTLPASITKHHKSVQPELLPHFVGATGELTKLQIKLKVKDELQKDKITLSEQPYVSKDGSLNQSALEELATHYSQKFAIPSERVFEALKEVWGFSMHISTGPAPQHPEKSRTLPSSMSLPAGSDYLEPFKSPEPDKNGSSIDKKGHEAIPTVTLTTDINSDKTSPRMRPLSVRLHDSKSIPSEPLYEEVDEKASHINKRFSHAGTASPSRKVPPKAVSSSNNTANLSVADENKKTKAQNERVTASPSRQHQNDSESDDIFPSGPAENGKEATKSEELKSGGGGGGFMKSLIRRITTKHPSTKSLSAAPGSPKLPSSKSMPAIADARAISKSSDDLSSEYSEVFDKVQQPLAKVAGTEPSQPAVHQEKTDENTRPALPLPSDCRKGPVQKGKELVDPSPPTTVSTSMDHTPRAGSTSSGSTSMDRNSRAGSAEDMAESCPIPPPGGKPLVAPRPIPRQSKKPPVSAGNGTVETPPMKPKRSMVRDASPHHKTSVGSITEVKSSESIVQPPAVAQSLPSTESQWGDVPSKPRPLPKPRPRNVRPAAAVVGAGQSGHGDEATPDCLPP